MQEQIKVLFRLHGFAHVVAIEIEWQDHEQVTQQ